MIKKCDKKEGGIKMYVKDILTKEQKEKYELYDEERSIEDITESHINTNVKPGALSEYLEEDEEEKEM